MGGCQEIVKYYFALKAHRIPVILRDIDKIAARFEETDNIGIVPDNKALFMSTYVPEVFTAEMHVTDTVSLGLALDEIQGKANRNKIRKQLVARVTWISEKTLTIAQKASSTTES